MLVYQDKLREIAEVNSSGHSVDKHLRPRPLASAKHQRQVFSAFPANAWIAICTSSGRRRRCFRIIPRGYTPPGCRLETTKRCQRCFFLFGWRAASSCRAKCSTGTDKRALSTL